MGEFELPKMCTYDGFATYIVYAAFAYTAYADSAMAHVFRWPPSNHTGNLVALGFGVVDLVAIERFVSYFVPTLDPVQVEVSQGDLEESEEGNESGFQVSRHDGEHSTARIIVL